MQWPSGGVVWRCGIGCDTAGDERACWDGCAVVSVAESDSDAQAVTPRGAGPVAWMASSSMAVSVAVVVAMCCRVFMCL